MFRKTCGTIELSPEAVAAVMRNQPSGTTKLPPMRLCGCGKRDWSWAAGWQRIAETLPHLLNDQWVGVRAPYTRIICPACVTALDEQMRNRAKEEAVLRTRDGCMNALNALGAGLRRTPNEHRDLEYAMAHVADHVLPNDVELLERLLETYAAVDRDPFIADALEIVCKSGDLRPSLLKLRARFEHRRSTSVREYGEDDAGDYYDKRAETFAATLRLIDALIRNYGPVDRKEPAQ